MKENFLILALALLMLASAQDIEALKVYLIYMTIIFSIDIGR